MAFLLANTATRTSNCLGLKSIVAIVSNPELRGYRVPHLTPGYIDFICRQQRIR